MRKSTVGWLALAALLLGATTLGYPWTLVDSPLSTYIGQVILEGGVPYRDAWDVRAPGVFFTYALQILLFGKSAFGLRIFDVLWQFATAWVIASISARLCSRQAAGLLAGMAYLLIYFSQNFWNWAQPDTFVSLPLALSFLFLLRGLEEQRSLAWFLAALLVGAATLFKLPFGLFGTLLLFAVARGVWPDWRKLATRLLALAAGLAVPLLVCCLYLRMKGGLSDFLETQLVFAPAYVARIHAEVGLREFLVSFLRPVVAPMYLMCLLGLGSFILRRRGPEKPHYGEAYVVAWLGATVLAFFLHGSFLGYHYSPFFAPSVILFALCVSRLPLQYRARRSFSEGLVLLLALLALAAPLEKVRQHTVFAWRALNGFVLEAPLREVGNYINQRTTPQDGIFVWGNAPVLYLYADRQSASRYLCTAYLSVAVPSLDYRAAAMQELQQNQPAYVVLFKKGSITPALPGSIASFEEFPALKELLNAEYVMETESELCTIFRRR